VALYTRAIFAAFDAQDVTALAAFMTDDVRSRLGNADVVEGKSAFIDAVNTFKPGSSGMTPELAMEGREHGIRTNSIPQA
jgi:hypothetical protein